MLLSLKSQKCFESAVSCKCLTVLEREFVVIVCCFYVVFIYSNVSLWVTGSRCDCNFADNVACQTFTIKRAKILHCAIVLPSATNIMTFIKVLLILVLLMFCHVGCAAVADFKGCMSQYFHLFF